MWNIKAKQKHVFVLFKLFLINICFRLQISFWYSLDQTQEEERQSQPWGHPVVLNPGLLQSILTPALSLPRKMGRN